MRQYSISEEVNDVFATIWCWPLYWMQLQVLSIIMRAIDVIFCLNTTEVTKPFIFCLYNFLEVLFQRDRYIIVTLLQMKKSSGVGHGDCCARRQYSAYSHILKV